MTGLILGSVVGGVDEFFEEACNPGTRVITIAANESNGKVNFLDEWDLMAGIFTRIFSSGRELSLGKAGSDFRDEMVTLSCFHYVSVLKFLNSFQRA